jgi:hypothetical protein
MAPQTSEQILSSWDKFALSKFFPGEIETPYVSGMNVSTHPTMTFSIAGSLGDVNDFHQTQASSPGTRDYLVIMFCPALSIMNFPGTPAVKNGGVMTF